MKESTLWPQESIPYPKAVHPALTKAPPLSLYSTAETLLPIKLINDNKTRQLKDDFMVLPERRDEYQVKSFSTLINSEQEGIRDFHNQMVKNCSVVLNRLPEKVVNGIDQNELLDNLSGPKKWFIPSADVRNSNSVEDLYPKRIHHIMENSMKNKWNNVYSNYIKSPVLVTDTDTLHSAYTSMPGVNDFYAPIMLQNKEKNAENIEIELSSTETSSNRCNRRSEDIISVDNNAIGNHFKEKNSNYVTCTQYRDDHEHFSVDRQSKRKLHITGTQLYSKNHCNESIPSQEVSSVVSSVQTSVIRVARTTSPIHYRTIIDANSSREIFNSEKLTDQERQLNSLDDSPIASEFGTHSQKPYYKESQESNKLSSNFIKPCRIKLSLSSENRWQNESSYYTVESSVPDRNRLTNSNFQCESSKEASIELNNHEEKRCLLKTPPSINKTKKVSSLSVYVQTEGSKLSHITCKRFRKRKRYPAFIKYSPNKENRNKIIGIHDKILDKESLSIIDDAVRETVRFLVDETLLTSFDVDNCKLDTENTNTEDLVRKFCLDYKLNFTEFNDLSKLFSFSVVSGDNCSIPQRRKYKRKSRFFIANAEKKKRKEEHSIEYASNMDYRELRKLPGRVKNKHLRGTVVKKFYLRPRDKNQDKIRNYQMSRISEDNQVSMTTLEEQKSESPVISETPKSCHSQNPNLESDSLNGKSSQYQAPIINCDSLDDNDCCHVIDDVSSGRPELRREIDDCNYENSTDTDTLPELVPVIVSSHNFYSTNTRLDDKSDDVTDSPYHDQSKWSFEPIRQKSESPKVAMSEKIENDNVSEFRKLSKSVHPLNEDAKKEQCMNSMAENETVEKVSIEEKDDDDETINITDDSTDGMCFSPNICESLLKNSYANPFDSESERREREREKSILRMLLLDSSGNEIPSEEVANNNGIPVITKMMSLSESPEAIDSGNEKEVFDNAARMKCDPSVISRFQCDPFSSSKLRQSILDASQHDSKDDVITRSKELLDAFNHHIPPLSKVKKLSNDSSSGEQCYKQPNNKDFPDPRRISYKRLDEARDKPDQSKLDNWINDPALLKDKIKRLRNEIVYLHLIAEQKEKERIAILCFKKYKEEMLKRIFRYHYPNRNDEEQCRASNEFEVYRRPVPKESPVNGPSRVEKETNKREKMSPPVSESFIHHHPYYPLPQRKTHSTSPFPLELRELSFGLESVPHKVVNNNSRHNLPSAFPRENDRTDFAQAHSSRGQILHQMLTTTTTAGNSCPPSLRQPVSSPMPWCEPLLKPRLVQAGSRPMLPKSVCQPSPLIPSVITRTNPQNLKERQEFFRNPLLATHPSFSVSSISERPVPKLVPQTTSVRTLQTHSESTVLHSPVPRTPLGSYYGPRPTHIKSSVGSEQRMFSLPKPEISTTCPHMLPHNLDHYRGSNINKQFSTETRTINASPVERRNQVPSADYSSQDFTSEVSNGNSSQQCPSCMSCGLLNAKYLCSGCRRHWYCSPKCQTLLWPQHSKVCSGREVLEHYLS